MTTVEGRSSTHRASTKEYGTFVTASEETWARVGSEFEGREIDWIRVKVKEGWVHSNER